MEIKCELIRDLIPLYTDELCGEYTKKVVDTHIDECPACRELLNQLREEKTTSPINPDIKKTIEPFKKIKRRNRILTIIISSLTLLTVTTIGYLFFIMEHPIYPVDVNVKKVEMLDEMTFSLTVSRKLLNHSDNMTLQKIELAPSGQPGIVYLKAYGVYLSSGGADGDYVMSFGFDEGALGSENINKICLIDDTNGNLVSIIWQRE